MSVWFNFIEQNEENQFMRLLLNKSQVYSSIKPFTAILVSDDITICKLINGLRDHQK